MKELNINNMLSEIENGKLSIEEMESIKGGGSFKDGCINGMTNWWSSNSWVTTTMWGIKGVIAGFAFACIVGGAANYFS